MNNKEYAKLVKLKSPNSKSPINGLKAFLIGGVICVIGQFVNNLWGNFGLDKQTASSMTSVTMIFLGALLTALGIYDKIAKHAGAGTLVPITGFSNAVCSAALEFKTEGFVLGVGANMFKIAGPVIVYGTVASVVYGVVYWITTLF